MKTIIQNLTAAMFIAASLQIHAQQALAPVQDSVVQAVADEAELTPIPATALPKTGTFWVMTTGYNGNLTALPYPTLPANLSALPIYSVAGNAFIVNDKIKILLSNHALEFSTLWLSSLSNPMKCSRLLAQLRPNTCNLMPLFRPIFPDSFLRACDARGFFGLKYDDMRMPQFTIKTGSGLIRNPIYVLYFV